MDFPEGKGESEGEVKGRVKNVRILDFKFGIY